MMNFTDFVNASTEELSTVDAQRISERENALYSSSAGDLWTTALMATLSPIVTDSVAEQAITVGLLMLFWIYVNVSNGSLYYVIKCDYSLHTPHYMVLVSYMVCDVLYCNFTLLIMVPVAVSGNIHILTDIVSRAVAIILTSFALASVHLIALLAYERYSYFITPFKYTRKFTKYRICTAAMLIYFFAFCVGLGVDLVEPRVPVATTMTYQAAGLAGQITNILYTLFYAIPSCTISVVTLIRLRLLISKHTTQVQPAQAIDMSKGQSAVGGTIVKPVKQALRMVALVSGSFWFTMLPGFLIRIGLSASGVTWEVTDYRLSLPLFALSRASHMLITVMSSILNPVIYVSVLRELREAAWGCGRIERDNSDTRN